jgi:alpha-N-acetylglucosaminidase
VRFTYENEQLRKAVELLLQESSNASAYEFDVVNLTRQYLSNGFEATFASYKNAYEAGDRSAMASLESELLGVFDTMEKLLSTQTYFLVGKWIADARAWGANTEEADYFESNARNLLTSWGPRGNLLTDYADRTWAGLVSTYYKGRWQLFFDAVNASLDAGVALDEDALLEQIKDFEYDWWANRPGTFSSTPTGDSVAAVREALGL